MNTATVLSLDERIPAPGPTFPARPGTLVARLTDLLARPVNGGGGSIEAWRRLHQDVTSAAHEAFTEQDAALLLDIHQVLYAIYELSFGNPLDPQTAHERSPWVSAIRQVVEECWLASEFPRIANELPAMPSTPQRICTWFEAQARKESPLDRKVVCFLAEEATLDQFITFILSDGYLNYRFFDALALAQLHYTETVKAELIRHMWDETGCGNPERAHTRQFSRTLATIGATLPSPPLWDDWRPYAGYNLYFLFGLNRRHYFKALGSLAMPELFDPDRDRAVVAGLRRLGFEPERDFEYYHSHIEGDEDHGPCWLEKVVRPVVEFQPEAALDLATGGALRMLAMSRYNEHLAGKFGLSEA
jgi:hypothetical protein